MRLLNAYDTTQKRGTYGEMTSVRPESGNAHGMAI